MKNIFFLFVFSFFVVYASPSRLKGSSLGRLKKGSSRFAKLMASVLDRLAENQGRDSIQEVVTEAVQKFLQKYNEGKK